MVAAAPVSAQVVINEYQTSNIDCVGDEDGDSPDWIELYNRGPDPVNLAGFGLTDRADKPHRWTFPEVVLPPASHLLVYASGKDRRAWLPHWETVIHWGDDWRYRVNLNAPPDRWWDPGFDDSGWLVGPSGFGYSDGDDATVIDTCLSTCLRTRFQVTNREHVRSACLHVDYDDAFVAWLNGVEIARANIGTPGTPPHWRAAATVLHEAQLYRGGDAEYFPIAGLDSLLVDGENFLAIVVHNVDPGQEDLSIIPFLTLGYDQPPPAAGGAAERIRLYLPHLHASFKLDDGGEDLMLFDNGGTLVDRADDRFVPANYSRGRFPDGANTWMLHPTPTPDAPNGEGWDDEFAMVPDFSLPGGRYPGPSLTVAISSPRPGATITYTLDASDPQEGSARYSVPLTIESTGVVRARAFEPGRAPSPIATRSYILDDQTPLAILSLVTDPDNLWNEQTGIYVRGPYARPTFPYFESNFWMDWERPAHAEFFPPEGGGFSVPLGTKIHGGTTRAFPQKPFRLITRGGYGVEDMACPVFPEKPIEAYRRLILRNAGNDWGLTYLRDAFVHRLAARIGLDHQAYRPAHVYLNGDYWGMYDIRECIDAFYFAENYGIDAGSVDVLELNAVVMEGEATEYLALLDFLHAHDLADDMAFASVAEQMDVENYADYVLLRVFCANTDWPGNNLRYWRSDEMDGRWRWVIQDIDMSLGINRDGVLHRTLAWALDPQSPRWQNAPWSTFLLRSLLLNPRYRFQFINRYADHLNTLLLPQSTLALWDQMSAGIAEEIPRQAQRWGHTPDFWQEQCGVVRDFLHRRPAIARAHLMEQFGLTDTLRLSLDIDPPGAGGIALAAVTVDSCWTGVYFRDVPLTLKAVPAAGFEFLEWSDAALPADSCVQVSPTGDYAVTARFMPSLPVGQAWQLVAPNPVHADAVLKLRLEHPLELELTVFDLLGRRVALVAGGRFERGEHLLTWTARGAGDRPLPSGVYFLRLASGNQRTTQRVVVVR